MTDVTYYSAYDLTIQSEFELPELVRVESHGRTPDVVIHSGNVEAVPEGEGIGGDSPRRIEAKPDICRLTYDGIGSFLLTDGDRIRVDLESSAISENKIFRRLLENELMALVLLQRGLLVLHASAVSINGTAALFLGDRGAGKSTTAAAFHAQGYPLLEDDTVGIRFDDGTPVVVPGVPQLRLSPDAVDALEFENTTVPSGDWGPTKRYQQIEDVPAPAPLAGCYLLQDDETLALKKIPPRNRIFALVTSTYAQGLLSDTDVTGDHFEQCAKIVETTPVQRLVRPKDHAQLPLLVNLVVRDLS